MTSATDLPQELCYDPMSFVVLTGLDIKYNAIHTSIWDAFSNNRRSDRVPISFGCLPGDHAYPRAKDKRTSYEWYIPKGILKTKWMDKHLHRVPAVVVIFYELDWDEHAWREKQMECASRVEVVRTSLQGRGTKVAVVLIQRSSPLPPGEDMVAAERAAALCSACDLSAKSLFVLPHTDHLLGYIIRLENAFYELANSYYHTESRRVKSHKEFLNKTTHQLLFVRHQFKIAFFNELMQDPANALKHYRQAYAHIHELRSHDTNNLEVKVIGGFISYKICRLCFLRLNIPLEAIAQFRRHVDSFKPKGGNPELMFEHSAWMSKQFTVFGDLFDEAIKGGLSAIQTQHPGFYYQQAAYYAQDRRTQANLLCNDAAEQEYPVADPLDTGGQPLDFYGQRPWRQGHQSIDPPDAAKEKDGILALKHQEAAIDHSWVIIPLLSNAVAQFRKYKCPRMKIFLSVQLGEEYYHAREYGKAAKLLSQSSWDYRNNKWWDILNRIQILTLRCAYLIPNVEQYISTAIEIMGKYSKVPSEDKTRIQMNLIRVVSGKVPEPEPLTPLEKHSDVGSESDHLEALESAKNGWVDIITENKVYNIDMDNLAPFVECKTSFQEPEVYANEVIILHVYLQTSCPFPVRFSELNVSLGNGKYDEHCIINDAESGDLYFEPGKFKHLTFYFPPDQKDARKSIKVSAVTLKIGSEANTVFLLWKIVDTPNGLPNPSSMISTKQILQNDAPANVKKWSDVNPILECYIRTRMPLVKVHIMHNPPALIHEVYKISLSMECEEKVTVYNITGSVKLEDGQPDDIINSTFLGLEVDSALSKTSSKSLEFLIGALSPGEKYEKDLYLHVTEGGIRKLHAKISYMVADEVNVPEKGCTHEAECICISEHAISFDTVPAFKLSSTLCNQDFGNFKYVSPGENFIAAVSIDCCSPWPVELQSGSVSLRGGVISTVNGNVSNIVEGIVLEEGEMANDAICMKCKQDVLFEGMVNVPIGEYALIWRRHTGSSEQLPFVSSSVELSTASVRSFPLKLDVTIPSNGVVLKEIPVTYKLHNCSEEPHELELICEVAENFMFSGVKLQRCRVLPGSEISLTYALYPLAAGFQALPNFRIREIPSDGQDASRQASDDEILSCSYLRQHMPSSVFIKPCDKNQ